MLSAEKWEQRVDTLQQMITIADALKNNAWNDNDEDSQQRYNRWVQLYRQLDHF